ncbi:hypothetical protein [Streptosporangium sp. NPDC000396]|uniref:hypothetical protein n=1 Tax=Streptosporangium sp. NPDC000396 TaxID=3366185 RepID=UPI00368A0737
MARPLPAWRDGTGSDASQSNDQEAAGETAAVPLWLAHLRPREGEEGEIPPNSNISITIEFDKADFEALSRRARSTGNKISDVIHAAVQREIGNKPQVITLMQRWNLHREDLDMAADVLGVDQLSEVEWGQVGIRRIRRS